MTASGRGRPRTPPPDPSRAPGPHDRPATPASAGRDRAWLAAALGSLLVLLWVTRGAPLGTPVADDYDFLHWMRFHRPLGLFDAMGGAPYWRPVSRQLYHVLLAPFFLRAPWVVALVHLGLLAVLVGSLYAVARRAFAPPLAAAIASFPVLARPARTLLGWPSAGEPLLALVFVALALRATLARRRLLASLAVLGAALSYEQGLLVVPLLVAIVASRRARERDRAREWLVPAAVGTALFVAGHLLAARSHAGLFGGAWVPGERVRAWPSIGPAVGSQLGIEDLAPGPTLALWLAYATLGAAGLAILAARPERRASLARRGPQVAAGAAWFVAGMLVASLGSPGWYPWRAMLPGLGLGVALVGALGSVEPWLVAGVVALRLVALLVAPAVPAGVEGSLPEASSRHAFIRVARLQRVVDSARRALLARHPTLPRGAAVRYWALPEMTAWGFDGARAVQVWYGDSTLTWDWLADPAAPHDAVLAFNPDSANPAVVIEPASLAAYAGALRALAAGAARRADSLLAEAVRAQGRPADAYRFALANAQARVAHALGDDARADAFNQLAWRLAGETPEFLDMTATLALARGRPDVAADAAKRCLEIAPADSEAARVLRGLGAGR